jgi:2-polyprenyl-3-methyl-5-hydroxy-6-metoxy-1,4-benzoquinol methylase
MKKPSTREEQYAVTLRYREQHGLESLGLMTNQAWRDDPKRLAFTFARYKFVAKMLAGCDNVLEVGCADAFATRIVVQEVRRLTAVDFDPVFVDDVRARMDDRWRFECFAHDVLQAPVSGEFDGVYALDVLEHIEPANEVRFLGNMAASLSRHGTLIVGMPSLESQAYASEISKQGHVNCKSMPDLKRLLSQFFHNVYMFSMNDEVVHTGHHKMAHYLIALCCNRK